MKRNQNSLPSVEEHVQIVSATETGFTVQWIEPNHREKTTTIFFSQIRSSKNQAKTAETEQSSNRKLSPFLSSPERIKQAVHAMKGKIVALFYEPGKGREVREVLQICTDIKRSAAIIVGRHGN